jgi:23S rRNA pseudouridine2605 synthase
MEQGSMNSTPLVRVLTDAGYGSRRETAALVKSGLVEVNGSIASSFTQKVDPENDSILVAGVKVPGPPTRRIYIMMNKPADCLSTTSDDRGRPTVFDLLPEELNSAGLHPAGRLDEDSTGLLILTNDGQFTYQLTHPKFEHDREYYVATTGRLTASDIESLEKGVEIEGQRTWPARVELLEDQSPYAYSITIHEGRKRQVRLMFAAVGQQVAMLKRVSIGGLLLGSLPEGAFRELTEPELRALLKKQRPTRPQWKTGGPGHAPSRRPPQAITQAANEPRRVSRSQARATESQPQATGQAKRTGRPPDDFQPRPPAYARTRGVRPQATSQAERTGRPEDDSRPRQLPDTRTPGERLYPAPSPRRARRPFDDSRPPRRQAPRFDGARRDTEPSRAGATRPFDDSRPPRRQAPRFEGARRDAQPSPDRDRRPFNDSRPPHRQAPRFEGARRDTEPSRGRATGPFDDSRPPRRRAPRFEGPRRGTEPSSGGARRPFDDSRPHPPRYDRDAGMRPRRSPAERSVNRPDSASRLQRPQERRTPVTRPGTSPVTERRRPSARR